MEGRDGNELSIGEVFVVVTVLFTANQSITYLGAIGTRFVFVLKAVCLRIMSVLLMDEISENYQPVEVEEPSLKIENGQFGWKIGDVTLSDINLKVKAREMLIVSGKVGCGKTTLLMGLLKEIHQAKGTCRVKGTIAFCGHNSWLVSSSIKDNILMGREYDGIHRKTFIFNEDGIVERVIDKVKTKDHAAPILENI